MSTRAQIMVKGSPVLVYKHCDGYPNGTLPFLTEFVDKYLEGRGTDIYYFLSQYLRHEAFKEQVRMSGDSFFSDRPQYLPSRSLTGWGLSCEIFEGIEFLYVVNLAKGEVEVHEEEFEEVYLRNKG